MSYYRPLYYCEKCGAELAVIGVGFNTDFQVAFKMCCVRCYGHYEQKEATLAQIIKGCNSFEREESELPIIHQSGERPN